MLAMSAGNTNMYKVCKELRNRRLHNFTNFIALFLAVVIHLFLIKWLKFSLCKFPLFEKLFN